jgi:hypothetical protein
MTLPPSSSSENSILEMATKTTVTNDGSLAKRKSKEVRYMKKDIATILGNCCKSRSHKIFWMIFVLALLILVLFLLLRVRESYMEAGMGVIPLSPLWQIVGNRTLMERKKWAVFYNIYIAPPKQNKASYHSSYPFRDLSYLIIRDQLTQLGTSYAASAGDLNIYYNTIGQEMNLEWIHNICTKKYNMTCTRMGHYDKEQEIVTLSAMYEFCSQHTDFRAIYLHNKGSFHPEQKRQTRWRRTLTASATSQMCLEKQEIEDQSNHSQHCNVCGLLFQPLPGPHFPGNMWTAKCSYISQLLSPREYHTKLKKVDTWIETQKSNNMLSAELFPLESHYTGRKRYEAEHWIGNHPNLVPCDVSPSSNLQFWFSDRNKFLRKTHFNYTREFNFSMAPRKSVLDDWVWYHYAHRSDIIIEKEKRKSKKHRTLSDDSLMTNARMLDYFLLRGLLSRWQILYERMPNTSHSWIWNWYPDGEVWRRGVEIYGNRAMDELIKNISLPIKLPKLEDKKKGKKQDIEPFNNI